MALVFEPDLFRRIETAAAADGMSASGWVRSTLRNVLDGACVQEAVCDYSSTSASGDSPDRVTVLADDPVSLAKKMLNRSRTVQHTVLDQDLRALSVDEVKTLIRHLVSTLKEDKTADVNCAVYWMHKIVINHPESKALFIESIKEVRADRLTAGSLLMFDDEDPAMRQVLERWAADTSQPHIFHAIQKILGSRADDKENPV